MKLKLNKKKVKTLSADNSVLPVKMTGKIAGGVPPTSNCPSDWDTRTSYTCTTLNCAETYNCLPSIHNECDTWDCRFSRNTTC
ncbi:hypothetical protein [Pseudoalteromonas sp. R3]|uniref:hypothetical protein n=1 Tax=Pseudoalteromonas sp. R3 TaxID=1709477 RepID=UPI0006B6561F|nr:hypothetical protein [Pseudoalteromonas sp. R3]AZZ97648.1 hypothetical protein ELR70_11270 [Pseudoalteromonas sp. R3]